MKIREIVTGIIISLLMPFVLFVIQKLVNASHSEPNDFQYNTNYFVVLHLNGLGYFLCFLVSLLIYFLGLLLYKTWGRKTL
ncbi:hypothetical protein J2T20_003968 [Paenibacillus wynnii]|nr:hypothetical protein [Paenibacillus wynnii]